MSPRVQQLKLGQALGPLNYQMCQNSTMRLTYSACVKVEGQGPEPARQILLFYCC